MYFRNIFQSTEIIHERAVFVFRFLLCIFLIYNILFIKWANYNTLYSVEHGLMCYRNMEMLPFQNILFQVQNDVVMKWIFLSSVCIYFMYAIGMFLPYTGILSFISFYMINQRYLPMVSGYEQLLSLFLFYSVLLQSIIIAKKNVYFNKHVTLLVFFQIAIIYFFNAINKNGFTWLRGDALHMVITNPCLSKNIHVFLVDYPIVCKILTYGALILELSIGILIVLSFKNNKLRYYAFILIILLHTSIFLLIEVGYFHIICSIYALLLLPNTFWEKIHFLDRFRIFVLSSKQAFCWRQKIIKPIFLFFTLFIFLRCICTSLNNTFIHTKYNHTFEKLDFIKNANNIFYQGWFMFSPNVKQDLGYLSIEAKINNKIINVTPLKPLSENSFKCYKNNDLRRQLMMYLYQKISVNDVKESHKAMINFYFENELYIIDKKFSNIDEAYLVLYFMPYNKYTKSKKYNFNRIEYAVAEYN